MNPQNFNRAITETSDLDATRTKELGVIVEKFPYFQAARALQLKGLYQNQNFLYNASLKQTAAYTTDRSVLFEYITSDRFKQHGISSAIKKRISEEEIEHRKKEQKWPSVEEAEQVLDPELFEEKSAEVKKSEKKSSEVIENEEEALSSPPIQFDKTEARSFSEWLRLTHTKPVRENKQKIKPEKQKEWDLIDRFIMNDPKIAPVKSVSNSVSLTAYEPESPLMTETLAKIYVEQKNYSKAIQAYKILILKNPKKSSLFADRIEEIENLIENKNK